MNAVPAEILREYAISQCFTDIEKIINAMKDMFRDTIQQHHLTPLPAAWIIIFPLFASFGNNFSF